MSSTVLYARVSPVDQSVERQEAQARAAGFALDDVIAGYRASALSTRLADCPEGRRLFDLLRRGDTLVVRWVDRLGRNDADVCNTIGEFMRRGVVVRTVLNNLVFDGATKDPMQMAVRDALIAFMTASAQAQAEATKEARRAGIELAKNSGADQEARRRYLGRKPSYTREQFETVNNMLAQKKGIGQIAAATGLTRQTVYRIRDEREKAIAALTEWEKRPLRHRAA